MEQFFGILQRGLGQLDATGEYEEGTLRELKESYQKFDAAMQQNMLRVIEQSLAKFPITLQIYIWSSLLAVLRDEKIIPYMGELTADDSLNLWQKVELMNQLQRTIFASEMIKDEEAEYKRNSDAYTALMDEIRQRNKKEFSYLPWEKRNKKIVYRKTACTDGNNIADEPLFKGIGLRSGIICYLYAKSEYSTVVVQTVSVE